MDLKRTLEHLARQVLLGSPPSNRHAIITAVLAAVILYCIVKGKRLDFGASFLLGTTLCLIAGVAANLKVMSAATVLFTIGATTMLVSALVIAVTIVNFHRKES